MLQNYQKIAPLLLLFIYGIGFTSLSMFYLGFKIDIIYYLSLTDIILLTVQGLFILIILIGYFIIIAEIFKFILVSLFRIKKNLKNSLKFVTVSFSLILIVIGSYLDYKYYGTTIISINFLIWLMAIIYFFFDFSENLNIQYLKLFQKNRGINKLVIVAILLSFISLFGASYMEGQNIRQNKSLIFNKNVEFNKNGIFYSTKNNNTLIFVGEKSEVIFIYNVSEKKTYVFYKNNLENLKFF